MKKMNLTSIFCLSGLLLSFTVSAAKKIALSSPDKTLKVEIRIDDKIYYDILCNDEILLKDNVLGMQLKGETLGDNPKLLSQKRDYVNQPITPVLPLKYSMVSNEYNRLTLNFKDNYSVEFRAFDEGIAYRFVTKKKNDVEVMGETFGVNFPAAYKLHLQQPGGFKTSYEDSYSHIQSNEWKETDKMSVLPILIEASNGCKIFVSESDLEDYPCMFLKGTGSGVTSTFPKVPLEFGDDGDRSVKILKEADYIAKTKGTRNFPWRYFTIAKTDKALLESTMTCKLATQNQLDDVSWIVPGQVSWEWWNDACPYGPDVNFVSGYNLETYKYYIDFASKYGINYIIMDEGWAKSTRDPYTPNPRVNLEELIRYGNEKNVGIVLWLTWLTVENNFELFAKFGEWGVKGVKIDFMDRSDQWMVNFYERVAKEAAKHKLFVDFHGAFKPAGLEYKYPNVISYEGVRGMEQMGGCRPDNSVYLPFMRNVAGPMDYTPGAMNSFQPNVYNASRPNAGSIGTRAYQMSLFVIFESALQMLADNPTLYYRNAECTEFITQVPTVWDETRALDAKVGEYVIVAKRKGHKWFIGAMTNNAQDVREFDVNLDFLRKGQSYQMTSFEDGINAGRQAMDYRKKTKSVTSNDVLHIKMVRNGGFAAVIE